MEIYSIYPVIVRAANGLRSAGVSADADNGDGGAGDSNRDDNTCDHDAEEPKERRCRGHIRL